MADLGNLNASLRLQCKHCDWRPPDDMTIEHVSLHYSVEHDTDQIAFDLTPVCSCGAAMTVTETRPTGGGLKDYVACGACGNTGHLTRHP